MVRAGKRVSSGGVEQSLEQFVAGLAGRGGEAVEPPACLLRMAAQVLSRVPAGADLEPYDLASELVVRMLEARRRSGPGELEALLAVDSLRGVLSHRLAQLASERVPGRSLHRELKAHVRRALASGRLGRGSRRPEALLVHGRYASERVRAAVAWVLAQGVPASVREVVARLEQEYALAIAHIGLEGAASVPEEGEGHAEAPVLARALRARLGRQGARLVAGRLRGATLSELCEVSGRKMTALHSHLHRLDDEAIRFVRAAGVGPDVTRAALRLLAAAA